VYIVTNRYVSLLQKHQRVHTGILSMRDLGLEAGEGTELRILCY
jgi:hypothetical protein